MDKQKREHAYKRITEVKNTSDFTDSFPMDSVPDSEIERRQTKVIMECFGE